MLFTLYMQIKLVSYSFLAGILLGFMFDIYKVFRGYENIYKLLIVIEDILFWILAAIIIFIFLLYTNQAVIGLYVYLCMAVGIYMYFRTISRKFTALQSKINFYVVKILRILAKYISYPFRIFLDKIKK